MHPSVVDFGGSPWNSHRYWMAITPYPNGDDDYENPSIVVSSDGDSWSVPSGLTNPIDAMPTGGHNADTELVYDGSSTLYCFYIDVVGTTARVVVRSSTDGVSWGSETELFSTTTTTSLAASPTVIKDGSTWKMWYVDVADAPNTLQYRTSSSPASGWSVPTECTFDAISGRDIWHLSVFKDGSTYRALIVFCDLGQNGNFNDTLHVASSSDGLDWTVDAEPVLWPSGGTGFDSGMIYRACAVIDGTDVDVWYSAQSSAGAWSVGRTSWPLSRFP